MTPAIERSRNPVASALEFFKEELECIPRRTF